MAKIVVFAVFSLFETLNSVFALLTDITTHQTHYGFHKNNFKNLKIFFSGFIGSFLTPKNEFCPEYHKNIPFLDIKPS